MLVWSKHLAGRDALPERLLALHLGNGASLCAILDGRFGGHDDGLFAAGRADHGHADGWH